MGSGSRSGFISLALGRGPSSSSFLSVLPGERREEEEEEEGSPSQPLKRSRDSLSLLRRGNERGRIDAPLSPFLTANF